MPTPPHVNGFQLLQKMQLPHKKNMQILLAIWLFCGLIFKNICFMIYLWEILENITLCIPLVVPTFYP